MNLQYHFLIAFQDTSVNTVATEVFRFTSYNDKWTVEENTLINGIHNPFSVKRNPSTVSHQELIIEFKPTDVTQKRVCYYVIKSIGDKDIILRVTGKGDCLRVQMSLKYVDFYRINKLRKTKSTFKLLNDSKFMIMFQFDIDNDQKIFEILPLNGTVEAFHYTLITATFLTKKEGIFTLDVPCLFPYNRPIYLQLFGANSPTMDFMTFEGCRASCLTSRTVFDYGQYFHLYSRYSNICSLTQKHFNFTSENNKVSSIIEMLNHTDECLKMIWDTENEKNFVIHPTVMSLRPKEKRFFECKFEPKCKEMLMGGHIYGRAQLYDLESPNKEDIIYLRLRLIGNSFEKCKVWNPNLLIPNLVQLPICYSNNIVYTTFVIERTGPFPATYHFIPPAETCFDVKPRVGIIKNTFQIFVVKFHPKLSYDSVYSEDWNIELNGRPEYLTSITFQGLVPEPKIIVGNNFTIDFGSIFPGATKRLDILVSNLSATPLKVKFFKRNKWFHVVNSEKIIDCFDDSNFIFIYKADLDVPRKNELTLEIYKMHEMEVIDGKSVVFPLTILADCCYSKLTSIPNYYNFKNVVCGEEHTTKFRIYNFGKSGVKFLLKCYKHFGSAQNDPFVINPNTGFLDPDENLDITVTLCSYESCIGAYCIRYHVLKDENPELFLENGYSSEYESSALLLKMDYYMYYPTLQIVELGKNQTGAFYGKKQIWDFFQVDTLNEMLQTIQVNETRSISVRLPDAQVGRKITKIITFILKNVTNTETTCYLKRKKICDCKFQQLEGTFTFRKFSYNCPHKEILTVSLIDNQIKALETTFLEVETHYKMRNTQNMCYLMHLSHNRTIEINFEIKSLEPGELSTYVLGMRIALKYISIRELSPAVQIYKIVNNTSTHSLYRLEEKPIKELNRKAGYPILICLNPTGQVKAKSCEGLMFVFAPISLSKICIDVPIQLGNINYVLHMEGEGILVCKPLVDVVELYAPYKEYYQYPFLYAHISLNEITIQALPTFNKVTRIFTLRNVSKDKTLAFWFANTYYEDIIHCSVIPSTGLIMPGCCIPLVLTVRSFSVPCTCQTFCSLHILDQTALNRHFKSNMEFHQEANTTNDFFTITDNNIIYYSKPTVQKIEPPPNVVHRNITITCKVIASSEMELKVPLSERLKMQPCQELSLYKPCDSTAKREDNRENADSINYSFRTIEDENDEILDEDLCVPGKCCNSSSDYQLSAVNIIAETVIRDVLESSKFQCKLSSYLSSEPELYYEDFCKQNRHPENDEKMFKLAVNRISDSMLSEIMQVLIGNAVINYFKLGTYPEMEINSNPKEQTTANINKKIFSEKFAFVLDSPVLNN